MSKLFENLSIVEAKAAETRRQAIKELKPEGLYTVRVESFTYDAEDGRTPSLQFQLRIVGMMKADDSTSFAMNGNNTPRFANACLFYSAYISSTALFSLQRLYKAQTGETLELESLIEMLSEFTNVAQLSKWVKSWMDSKSTHVVSVRQDTKSQKPRNTVSFI